MRFDAIIVGAGHNGLVAANYLARAGLRVLVCERRTIVGGACVTEEFSAGQSFSSCASVLSCLRLQIIEDLQLERHGLDLYQTELALMALRADGACLRIWPALHRTLAEFDRLQPGDGDGFIDFGVTMRRFSSLMAPYLLAEPPSRAELRDVFGRSGEPELFTQFFDWSADALMERFFRGSLAKGAMSYLGLVGLHGGTHTPGSAYLVGHHALGNFSGGLGGAFLARGGMGAVTTAMSHAAKAAGATIKTDSAVAQILVHSGRATGVVLRDGQRFLAPVIVSNADPHTTYLELISRGDLPGDTALAAQGIDFRGAQARLLLVTRELPLFVGQSPADSASRTAVTLLGPDIDAYRRCADASVDGELADDYPIELLAQSATDKAMAIPGTHTIGLGIQQIPYRLRKGSWDERREEFTNTVLRSLFRYAPNLKEALLQTFTLTPLDIERRYGLHRGNQFHGTMVPSQVLADRPLGNARGYRTAIPGLYLCGAGTHPGGGVMGACGHNAANSVLHDLGIVRSNQSVKLPTTQRGPDISHRLATNPRLRKIRNWLLRRPWLG
jgi:phytoene dehydrogenase-like protein